MVQMELFKSNSMSRFSSPLITSWCVQIANRLMLALSLLKKEYELSKLQQKIGKEVCQIKFSSN